MSDYTSSRLDELGKRRAKLRGQLAAVNAELDAEIVKAAAAGVIQAEIARRTGMTRESVAQKISPKPRPSKISDGRRA